MKNLLISRVAHAGEKAHVGQEWIDDCVALTSPGEYERFTERLGAFFGADYMHDSGNPHNGNPLHQARPAQHALYRNLRSEKHPAA